MRPGKRPGSWSTGIRAVRLPTTSNGTAAWPAQPAVGGHDASTIRIEWLGLLATCLTLGCTPEPVGPDPGTGGTSSSSGGVPASGGAQPGTGGRPSTGGRATGGLATGGQASGGTASAAPRRPEVREPREEARPREARTRPARSRPRPPWAGIAGTSSAAASRTRW